MGKALAAFIKRFGRKPKDKLEWLQWRFKFAQESGKGKVIEFPPGAITDWRKPRPTTGKKADVTELDEPLVNEFQGPPHGYGAGHGTADPTQAQRIRQGFSTQSKLNSWSQNQSWVKDFIGRKNAEFNFLNKDDQKKVLEMFETQIKKHMPKERKAGGGIAGMLGEPTYQDDNHRVPLWKGSMVESAPRQERIQFLADLKDFEEEQKKIKENNLKNQLLNSPEGVLMDPPFWEQLRHKDATRVPNVTHPWWYNEEANFITFDDGTIYYPNGDKYIKQGEPVEGPSEGARPVDKKTMEAAEGGRVPLVKGKIAKYATPEGLAKLIEKLFPGTTKLGKTSRPMAEKTQLKRAIAGFQEREAAKNKITSHSGSAVKAGEGRFTKAEVLIMRLENTIKDMPNDKYVQETFPNFIKEIKANPKIANNENVWKNLGMDLPKDQQLVVHGDDTVDFFRQTEFGPHNIEGVTRFHEKHPFLTRKEAIKISKMEPTDQVMELKRLETIRRTTHATGGRVSLSSGGLAGILGE